jgi:hypothetical protein
MLVLVVLFRINIGALLGGAVCVYLGTSQTTVGVMLSYQLQLLWLLVYTFNNRNIPWL